MADYLDFHLVIEREGPAYRARVESPAGEASAILSIPFSKEEVANFRGHMNPRQEGSGGSGLSQLEAARAFGARLFACVFDKEIGTRLWISRSEAGERNGLRIRLRLKDVPELANLPWEYLYDPTFGFLSLNYETAIVRDTGLSSPHRVLAASLPLRVLVVTSSSDDYQMLDVEREWIALREALSALERRGLVSIERLEEGSLRDLRDRLRQEESHIVHFIGSGGFDKETKDGFLLMRDQNNPDQRVSAQTLGRVLLDSPSTRLAILTGRQGAVGTGSDPFSATAQTLVRQGLPAVIGMQSEITDQASIAFASEFYVALAHGAPVDYALTEFRISMAFHEDNLDWGAPILYLNSSDGRIFDLDDTLSHESMVGAADGSVDSSIGFVPGASPGISPIPDALPERRINVWVRERAELTFEPLKVGESYTLNLGVGEPVAASLLRDQYAVVPDWDVPESGLDTKWVITSDSVELASTSPDVFVAPTTSDSSMAWVANFSLHIPRRGDSSTCTLGITPRYAAEARLEVMIFVGTEQYRKFTINLAVDDVATRALSGPQLSPATVSDDCANAPLAHQNLRTTHEWTTPPGRISIIVVSADKAYVVGDAGTQPVNDTTKWRGAPSMVAGPMQNVRSTAEKFRAKWERYLNDIDAADLTQRLNHFSPQYDWSALRDDSDTLHQREWQSVALSPELRDLAYDGHSLYETFFPLASQLRFWLDALQPSWRINITWQQESGGGFIPHVPWGLMYQPALPVAGQPIDPMGFLGLRYRIEYTAHSVNAKSKALGRVEDAYRSHFLYWGNDPQDLTGAEARWQQQQWRGWPKQVFVPKGPAEQNPKATLLSLLDSPSPNPATILYLFCQCSVGDGNDPVLRFGDTLQPADIVRRSEIGTQLLADQPLVFANACTTGAADPYMANELESVFFRRGCRAYIGTECKVPIQLASRFASAFFNFLYRKVDSQPMAAGEAVAQARLLLWTQYKNIGGLFYNYVNLYELFMAQDSEVLSLQR